MMDIWLTEEVGARFARVEGNEPLTCARFAIYCLFASIVGGELFYILIKTARSGRRIAPFNLMIPVLGFLLTQFIILASLMWLAYTPWRPVYPVCVESYKAFPSCPLNSFQTVVNFAFGLGMFCSIWVPLALAEVTTLLHFIIFKDMGSTGSTSDRTALKNKRVTDWMFIGLSVVTNIVRNAIWLAHMESPVNVDWSNTLIFQHFYFGVEGMTLINIAVTAKLLNPAEHQHQVVVSIPSISSVFRRRA